MKLFGRKSAVPGSPPLVPWFLTQPSDDIPQSYAARFQEVFVTNPVGQRSVRLVAGAVASLTVEVNEGAEEAQALVGNAALLERIAAQLLLNGNAFVQMVEADGELKEMFPLRPENVTVVPNARGWPVAYDYRVNGQTVRIASRDALARRTVLHLKALHPGSESMGLGCLDAAIAGATIHNRASRWNKSLLDNAARPSGALVYEPADGSSMSAAQFDRLRQEVDAHFSGSGNAGRPLLLDGGLKWQALSLTPADMDFVGLKAAAARDIALAFGVPPMLVGLPGDNTYSNLREASRALYRLTVLPLALRIIAVLQDGLSDWLGPLKLAIDVDQISELAEDRERMWAQIEAASFLSEDEKRAMLGFPPRMGVADGK